MRRDRREEILAQLEAEKRAEKKKRSNGFCRFISIIYTIFAAAFVALLIKLNALPEKYLYAGIGILVVVSIFIVPVMFSKNGKKGRKIGATIIRRAIEEPVRQIAENAGLEGSVIVNELRNKDAGVGFNAATGEFVNMIEAGIIDPTKVTRTAIQNAASICAMFLTTEVAVADLPEEAAPAMPPMGGGGMPMM